MKNSADLGGCYSPRSSASVDNTLLDLQNSSHPSQSHSIIAEYYDTTIAAYESCYTSEKNLEIRFGQIGRASCRERV